MCFLFGLFSHLFAFFSRLAKENQQMRIKRRCTDTMQVRGGRPAAEPCVHHCAIVIFVVLEDLSELHIIIFCRKKEHGLLFSIIRLDNVEYLCSFSHGHRDKGRPDDERLGWYLRCHGVLLPKYWMEAAYAAVDAIFFFFDFLIPKVLISFLFSPLPV